MSKMINSHEGFKNGEYRVGENQSVLFSNHEKALRFLYNVLAWLKSRELLGISLWRLLGTNLVYEAGTQHQIAPWIPLRKYGRICIGMR